jgi:hypothetical protein
LAFNHGDEEERLRLKEAQMRHTLALTILALLALGFASQAQAQQRIACYKCQGLDTWAHYYCDVCPYPGTEWNSEAYSDNGLCPPYDEECPVCHYETWASYCWCKDCVVSKFWKAP